MSRAQEEWVNFWTEAGAVLLVFNLGLSIIGLPWFFFGLPKFVMDYNKLQPSDFFWFPVSFLVVLVSWGISIPILYGLFKHDREEDRRKTESWAQAKANVAREYAKREADNKLADAKREADKLADAEAKRIADAKREADKLADAEANKAYKRIMAEHQAKAKRKNKGK